MWTIWTLNFQWRCCILVVAEWLKLERVGETELTQIQTQSKCLAAFYMLGLLNRSIFIDLTPRDLNFALLRILHFYFLLLWYFWTWNTLYHYYQLKSSVTCSHINFQPYGHYWRKRVCVYHGLTPMGRTFVSFLLDVCLGSFCTNVKLKTLWDKKEKNSNNNWGFAFFCSPSQSLVVVCAMTDLEQGKVAQCLQRGILTHICMLLSSCFLESQWPLSSIP